MEGNVQRKEREIAEATTRLEGEQAIVSKQQRTIKEVQGRIEEHEEELEAERQARAKAERQKADLAKELEELTERLEESCGATQTQMELNKKREMEVHKYVEIIFRNFMIFAMNFGNFDIFFTGYEKIWKRLRSNKKPQF